MRSSASALLVCLELFAMASSSVLLLLVFGLAVSPTTAAAEDRCSSNTDMFACRYNVECIWCTGVGGEGRCANWTMTPTAGEKCDSLAGCQGRRSQAACDAEASCKWCHSLEQGWPLCANRTDDGSSRAATCDKKEATGGSSSDEDVVEAGLSSAPTAIVLCGGDAAHGICGGWCPLNTGLSCQPGPTGTGCECREQADDLASPIVI